MLEDGDGRSSEIGGSGFGSEVSGFGSEVSGFGSEVSGFCGGAGEEGGWQIGNRCRFGFYRCGFFCPGGIDVMFCFSELFFSTSFLYRA